MQAKEVKQLVVEVLLDYGLIRKGDKARQEDLDESFKRMQEATFSLTELTLIGFKDGKGWVTDKWMTDTFGLGSAMHDMIVLSKQGNLYETLTNEGACCTEEEADPPDNLLKVTENRLKQKYPGEYFAVRFPVLHKSDIDFESMTDVEREEYEYEFYKWVDTLQLRIGDWRCFLDPAATTLYWSHTEHEHGYVVYATPWYENRSLIPIYAMSDLDYESEKLQFDYTEDCVEFNPKFNKMLDLETYIQRMKVILAEVEARASEFRIELSEYTDCLIKDKEDGIF